MRVSMARVLWLSTLVSASALPAEIALSRMSSIPFFADTGGRRLPEYENGYIMSVAPTLGDIWVFDESGKRIREVQIALPDADLERVNATAMSRDGRLVAAVTGYTSDGKMVTALAWINSSGNIENLVRSSPFAVRQLRFADDGTLWTLGDVYDETFTNQPVRPYDVLWQFDAHGKRIRTVLPNTSFSTNRQVASHAHLVVSGNIIGVYYEAHDELVEISTSGVTLGRWAVHAPPSTRVTRVALASSGDLVIQQREGPPNKASGTYTYLFNRQSGDLSPVSLSAVDGKFPLLLGADGDKLMWRAIQGNAYTLALTGISH